MEKQDGLSSMGASALQQGPRPLHHAHGPAGSWLPRAHRSPAVVLGMMKAKLLVAYQGMWTLGFMLSCKGGCVSLPGQNSAHRNFWFRVGNAPVTS